MPAQSVSLARRCQKPSHLPGHQNKTRPEPICNGNEKPRQARPRKMRGLAVYGAVRHGKTELDPLMKLHPSVPMLRRPPPGMSSEKLDFARRQPVQSHTRMIKDDRPRNTRYHHRRSAVGRELIALPDAKAKAATAASLIVFFMMGQYSSRPTIHRTRYRTWHALGHDNHLS
jgi:hypothetical protein